MLRFSCIFAHSHTHTRKSFLPTTKKKQSKHQFLTCLCMLCLFTIAWYANNSNNHEEHPNKGKWFFHPENSFMIFAAINLLRQNSWMNILMYGFWDFDFLPNTAGDKTQRTITLTSMCIKVAFGDIFSFVTVVLKSSLTLHLLFVSYAWNGYESRFPNHLLGVDLDCYWIQSGDERNGFFGYALSCHLARLWVTAKLISSSQHLTTSNYLTLKDSRFVSTDQKIMELSSRFYIEFYENVKRSFDIDERDNKQRESLNVRWVVLKSWARAYRACENEPVPLFFPDTKL